MGRGEERKSDFKKGVDASAGRRRREDTQIQLRKQKKEEQLAKRRAPPSNDSASVNGGNIQGVSKERPPRLEDVPVLLRTMNDASSSAAKRLDAVREIRRLTSSVQHPPVEQLVQSGVLPFMVRFLGYDDEPMLQFEAAWVLTNVASTDFTKSVVEAGALPGTVRLLECPMGIVREQAAWLLGNVAGDGPELRDVVLRSGAMSSLLRNVQSPHSISLLKNVMWLISNLCRGKPQPDFEVVKDSIPAILYAAKHQYTSIDAQIDSLWALSYLTDGPDERIKEIINFDVIRFAMSGLSSGKSSAITPSLRVLGNIVTGTTEPTQAVIDAGILEVIFPFLSHAKKTIRRESAWLLSNIAAGTEDQVGALLKKTSLVALLVDMSRNASWEIRKECIYAVSNMICGGSPKHIATLVDMDAIESMTDVLDLTDSGMVLVALEAVENVLRVGKQGRKRYDVFFDECDGIAKLEVLQHHTNPQVYDKSVEIIEEFFGFDEEDADDENLAPAQSAGSFYSFGFGSPGAKNLFPSQFGTPTPTNTNMATQSPAVKFDFGGGFAPTDNHMES